MTSISGSALSGEANAISSEAVQGGNDTMFAWQGIGSGTTNGAVTVNFTSSDSGDPIIVDVVQLAAGDTVDQSGIASGDNVSPTVQIPSIQNSSDGEVAFVATSSNEGVTKPTAFTALSSGNANTNGGYGFASFDDATATTSATGSIAGGTSTGLGLHRPRDHQRPRLRDQLGRLDHRHGQRLQRSHRLERGSHH